MQKEFFFTPFIVLRVKRHTGLGLASVSQPLASEEDSEKIIQPTINLKKRRGNRGHSLRAAFIGAIFCQVARISAVVAVRLAGFSAVHSDVADIATPRHDKRRTTTVRNHRLECERIKNTQENNPSEMFLKIN